MEELEMIRGDTFIYPHAINIKKDNESYQLQGNENIIFSLKRFSGDEEYVLQKSLNNGITWDSSIQKYVIKLEPEDTKDIELRYESMLFQYDIVVILKNNLVKTIRGSLKIWRDITRNETATDTPEDTGLTEEQINAINSITIDLDDELSIEYDETVLDLDFTVEDVDLVVDNNIEGVEFNINETGELEVNYE